MSETTSSAAWITAWGEDLSLTYCRVCDAVYLIADGRLPLTCPYCGQVEVSPLNAEADAPVYTHAPELLLPFSVPENRLQENVTEFAKSIWFAPADMTPERLNGRLQPVYLPMWLVDANVQAQWQAEVGFNYDVISHRERYKNGEWHTQEVRETRIRWEPRLGRLQRTYENNPAPALEELSDLERTLGAYTLDETYPYQPNVVVDTAVRLPNRPPDDAWPDAQIIIQRAAAAECRRAGDADHIRDFSWSAQYRDQHWTQLLLPLYTTHYRDDDGLVQMVYVHGQTGKLVGQRRASMKKARRWALIIAAVAVFVFIVSLLFGVAGYFAEALLPFAGIGLIIAAGIGVTAVIPLLLAWYVNVFSYFFNDGQKFLTGIAQAALRQRK